MKDVKDAKDDEKEEVGAASSKVKNDEPDESFTSILASKPYNSDYEMQVRVCVYACVLRVYVKRDEPDDSFTSILSSKPYNSDYEIQVCMHVCIHTQTHIHTHTNLIHACIHI